MTPDTPPAPATPEKAWYVSYHDGEGEKTTWANGLVEDVPPRTVAESGSWEFYLVRGGARGRVDPLEHSDRYQALQQLGTWAGRYVLKEPIEAEPVYTEQVPPEAPSLLVGIWPSYPTVTPGVWGLVDSIDETNRIPEAELRVTLSVTLLATMDDYDTREEIEGALSY